MTDISATNFFRQAAGETHPRPQLPPEQEEALGHPDFIEHRRRSLNLAKNPVPGTAIWRGEAREGEPHEALQHSGVGMHWTVNPDSAFTPHPEQGQRRVFWQGRVDHPDQQAIPRSHPSWGGNNGHSMDHEAEVRLHPGSSVHIDGAYVWHGQGDPQGHPVPRKPERTHPDWKWHPVGQHAQVQNHGHISYDLSEPNHSDAKMPPPWTGANPHAVLEHEHAAGNHHSTHPGGSFDDIDWDAPGEHVDGHTAAVMTDGVLKDGWVKPHELSDHDASEWLRWHPDRAGIEQRHSISRQATAAPESYARQDGEDFYDHQHRVTHGLSMGHLTTEQAEGTGGYNYVRDGWHPLPQSLYHTTTDAAGVAAHGLKTGRDLGQKRGHGLGGSPQYLSLTDSAHHAQAMLHHLHEYHDVVTGKMSMADMHEAAKRGDGASEPYHERLATEFGKKDLEHALKGQRYSHSTMTDEDARKYGFKPSDDHERVKDWQGNDAGSGWVKDLKPEEEQEHTRRLYDRFSYARSKHGGPGHVFFSSNDHEAFAKKDPSNFAVMKVRPKPGAQGFENRGEHEWRTGTGDAVQVHGDPIRRQARRIKASERPEWADGDFTAKTGHTYHTVTEPKAVTMRTPEGRMAGYVNWGDNGVIGNMTVRDEHQRRGIATELLRRAREQRPDIQHSDRLSNDAQAWLKGIGERTASADTPVPDNTRPYEHHHDWLPRDHFFAPGKDGLDPRLFDGDRMRPEVSQRLLSLLHGFWAPKYGDSWQSWARVYLAGSEASHFYGNDDLDILIGIDYDAARHHVDAFTGEPDGALDKKLTDELREGLNDDARMLPGRDGKETGPWESTWFVNPGSYDIRVIKPYAAYDITRDEWAVKPVEVPDDFGPEKLPESTWDVFDALQTLIKAVGELPEGVREREGAALYDYLHADRHEAFGPDGTGLYDPANAAWKALDKAPGKPLQQLIDWKHAHDGASATNQETAA